MLMSKKQKTETKSTKELDSVYFLKLVMYFVFGSMWLSLQGSNWLIPLPVGLAVGVGFAMHEHFQIDRNIELAVLLVASLMFYFLSPGLVIKL